eukprot:scaffold75477_cov23-Tisochrysis_lutea.AAC.1
MKSFTRVLCHLTGSATEHCDGDKGRNLFWRLQPCSSFQWEAVPRIPRPLHGMSAAALQHSRRKKNAAKKHTPTPTPTPTTPKHIHTPTYLPRVAFDHGCRNLGSGQEQQEGEEVGAEGHHQGAHAHCPQLLCPNAAHNGCRNICALHASIR